MKCFVPCLSILLCSPVFGHASPDSRYQDVLNDASGAAAVTKAKASGTAALEKATATEAYLHARAQKPPEPTAIGRVWVRPTDGARMVAVPAGEFLMGDDVMDGSKPQHKVTLDGYWIDETTVTVAQYRKFCGAIGRQMPHPPTWGWKDDHPIVEVTWADAAAYADWAGAALPTEAQWEKAARGTDGRKYPWGNNFEVGRLQCSIAAEGSAGSTAPVTSHPTGKSPYGALDMAGNVWQWCSDWYSAAYYAGAPDHNPSGPPTGEIRALRGGCWFSDYEYNFRCAVRSGDDPTGDGNVIGFRCATRAGFQ